MLKGEAAAATDIPLITLAAWNAVNASPEIPLQIGFPGHQSEFV
jgi:hypothetical protein